MECPTKPGGGLGVAEFRSQLVSSVSHELKAPNASIHTFAGLLKTGRARKPAATGVAA